MPLETVKEEMKTFVRYWTEKNLTGRKARWEMQGTFEVHLRFENWMRKLKNSVPQNKIRNSNGNVKLHDGSEAKWWGGKWVDASNPNVTIDLAYYPELTK